MAGRTKKRPIPKIPKGLKLKPGERLVFKKKKPKPKAEPIKAPVKKVKIKKDKTPLLRRVGKSLQKRKEEAKPKTRTVSTQRKQIKELGLDEDFKRKK